MADVLMCNQGRGVVAVNGVIGAVRLGGVNLYKGTRDFSGNQWISLENWAIEQEKYNGFTVISRNYRWMGVYQTVTVKAGEPVTISFYGKADGEVSVGILGTDQQMLPGYATSALSTNWKRYAALFIPVKDGQVGIKIENGGNDETFPRIYLCGIKVERGNVSTDWTPAPEDIPAMAPVQSVNGVSGAVQIGGRNLLLRSNRDLEATGSRDNPIFISHQYDLSVSPNNLVGKRLVMSAPYELRGAYGGISDWRQRIFIDVQIHPVDGETDEKADTIYYNDEPKTGRGTLICDIDLTGYAQDSISKIDINTYIQGLAEGYAYIGYPKLEVGTVATDWSPAPEDYTYVGGRNLALKSKREISNAEYFLALYYSAEKIAVGETYTVQIKGTLGEGRTWFIVENLVGHPWGDDGNVFGPPDDRGVYTATVVATQELQSFNVYQVPGGDNGASKIEWIKVERGNFPTDWSPAPEDILTRLDAIEAKLGITADPPMEGPEIMDP